MLAPNRVRPCSLHDPNTYIKSGSGLGSPSMIFDAASDDGFIEPPLADVVVPGQGSQMRAAVGIPIAVVTFVLTMLGRRGQ